jgi:hypothetical protein
MRGLRVATLALVAMTLGGASATDLEAPIVPGLSAGDPKSHVRVDVYRDRRTVAQIDTRADGIEGVFDPIHDADVGPAGRSGPLLGRVGTEGVIIGVRPTTPAEWTEFSHNSNQLLFVLTYSSGDVIVIDGHGSDAVKPVDCKVVVPVVSNNIACKFDLEAAKEASVDEWQARLLRPGPPASAYKPPATFSVPHANIEIHVGADLRTVVASDHSGRQLWKEDPFEEAGMKPYRVLKPLIVFVGPFAKGRFAESCAPDGDPAVTLTYSSSQFGCLDARTGRFVFMGQN